LDWRSGASEGVAESNKIAQQLDKMADLLQHRDASFFYIQAPTLPLHANQADTQSLHKSLLALMLQLRADVFPATFFSLNSYLHFGVPFASNQCGDLAEKICAVLLPKVSAPKKLLITDLDNVMWAGVIGEDGLQGIQYAPEAAGYPHFIYQTLLRKLKGEGVLLAAVSKNDPDLARAPFHQSLSVLKEDDFVTILASYQEKAMQIAALVEQLNLGLDACVFVDDNPVEIAAVKQHLPLVHCLTFPAKVDGLIDFFAQLEVLFSNPNLTQEDKNRTSLYRTRLAGMAPVTSGEVNLENFLRELEMVLQVFDRSASQQERAIQLINKTNQFNINGIRFTEAEVHRVLEEGGRLLTASLKDKHGDHGEIVAGLLDRDEKILALVMSCRVMQRKVEHVFLGWLANNVLGGDHIRLQFVATDRNTPVQHFLKAEEFQLVDDLMVIERHMFVRQQQAVMGLFTLSVQH
jgi:FkbH-like protein